MKIKNIEILHFRGIPNKLFVDFTDKKGKPVSTIISGDNGVGKSSILDAIEYNLQGRIYREPLKITSEGRMPLSLKYKPFNGCNTIVELEDKGCIERFERGIDVLWTEDKTEFSTDNKYIHRAFSMCPVVLRRNDIFSFGIIPKEKRQILFFSFLYQNFLKIEDAIENWIHWEGDLYLTQLRDKFIELKQERRELVEKLANTLDVDSQAIPFGEELKLRRFILKIKGKDYFKNIPNCKRKKRLPMNEHKRFKVYRLFKNIANINTDIIDTKETLSEALNPDVYGVKISGRREKNAELIKSTEQMLTESFKKVSNLDFINEIHLELGEQTNASFGITIKLQNGRWTTPQQIFSEANYDLMVLLLYLSIIRVSTDNGQAKVLILDDVLQSVDSVIRAKFVDYVLTVCHEWQLIVSCHDDLWKQQLFFLFHQHGVQVKQLKLVNWNFEDGPEILDESKVFAVSTLQQAIITNNKQIIASQAGLTLELLCQKLSVSLSISIHRKANDKYTIGDLWPGIKSKFKKVSILKPLLDDIDRELIARNMLGCHANEFALSMSNFEIISFANNILKLYQMVYCQECQQWISLPALQCNIVAECACRKIQYING